MLRTAVGHKEKYLIQTHCFRSTGSKQTWPNDGATVEKSNNVDPLVGEDPFAGVASAIGNDRQAINFKRRVIKFMAVSDTLRAAPDFRARST